MKFSKITSVLAALMFCGLSSTAQACRFGPTPAQYAAFDDYLRGLAEVEGTISFVSSTNIPSSSYADYEDVRVEAEIATPSGDEVEVHLIDPGMFIIGCGVRRVRPEGGETGFFYLTSDNQVVHWRSQPLRSLNEFEIGEEEMNRLGWKPIRVGEIPAQMEAAE